MLPGKPWILYFTLVGLGKAWNMLKSMENLKKIFHSIYFPVPKNVFFNVENDHFNLEWILKRTGSLGQ